LLKEIEKLGCKPTSTPVDSKIKLNIEDDEQLEDINQFQRLVGKLIYLTVIRPDISFSISQISKFMHAPRTPYLEAINRILRYLKGTRRKRVWMKNNNSNDICGYSDADWAESFWSKINNRFLHICRWKFGHMEKQETKRCGSIKRRNGISSHGINRKRVDLGIEIQSPMKMFCDNQAAKHIASNLVFHERIKHIEVDCHFVREKIQAKKIETPFVRRKNQLTGIFTKGLEPRPFEKNLDKLWLIDIYNPNLGGSVEKYKNLRINL
jgi:hypothetical protein